MNKAIDIFARTLWAEARGEPIEGKVAVACSIMNRVNTDLGNDNKPDWWGEGIEGVCLKPYQFSCWNHNDPNRPKLLAVTEADPMFRECIVVARLAAAGLLVDNTKGSTHYHTVSMGFPASWRQKGKPDPKPVVVIHKHAFYNNVK